MKKQDVFNAIGYIMNQLKSLIDVETVRIDFSTDKQGESSICVTVFYSINSDTLSNYSAHFFRVNEKPISINQILHELKARAYEIQQENKTKFTVNL